MPTVLASLSALTWGVSDFLGGILAKRAPAMLVVLWSQAAGLALAAVVAPVFGGPGLTRPVVVWGAAAGLAGNLGLVSLYRGLADGAMAVVAPVSAVVAAAIPVVVGLVAGERPDLLAWLGMAVALPAIWLVSRQGNGRWGEGLPLGLTAGAGFGMFFVFLSLAPEDAGLWPLVPSRLASILLMVAVLTVGRSGMGAPRAVLPRLAVVGIGDMLANMLFLAAVQRGLLSLISVVSSLYPVVTVVLARWFLAEAVGLRRWAGIVLALVALVLISV